MWGQNWTFFLDGPGWIQDSQVRLTLCSEAQPRIHVSKRFICPWKTVRISQQAREHLFPGLDCHADLKGIPSTDSAETILHRGRRVVVSETSYHIKHANFEELRKQRTIGQSEEMSLRGHALRRLRRNGFGRARPGPTLQQQSR